jgi:sterol desaturase/sphingolipid hydroxylase (fatty acid hydroxylase superfamily)
MPLPVPASAPPARSGFVSRDLVRRLGSSPFNYWFGYVANLALVAWLAGQAYRGGELRLGPLSLGLLALGGMLSWTLAEYLLHRYVYHRLPSFLNVGHGLHHASPRAQIGVPWWLTTVLVLVLFYLLTRLLDPAAVGVFLAATWLGYVLYCIIHHGTHRWHLRNRWFQNLRRRHLIHHAHPQYNLGFTTPLWDHIFGTNRPASSRTSRLPPPPPP